MLVSGPAGNEQVPSIWTSSVVGGQLRKLRDDAWLAAPSPDGASVAFISADYREIWLMHSNGEDPHRLLAVESGATFLQVAFAPDGQRIGYLKNHSLSQERTVETCDLRGGQNRLIWRQKRLKNFCWVPGGRIIGTLSEPNQDETAGTSHSDLWQVEVGSGPPGTPKRLTSFAGFTPLSLSVTGDGKHLALIRDYDQSDVYTGQLEANGTQLVSLRRLTLDDRIDWPGGWTRDSKAVLFYSDRQGSLDIFKQGVEDRAPELVQMGSEEKRQPQVSPDRAWIIYLAWPKITDDPRPAGRVMRIPVAGGPPETVFEVKGYPGSAQVPRESGTRVLTSGGQPDFRCPHSGASTCVLSEGDSSSLVFYSFDPVNGKQGTAARADVNGPASWDLSPDGSRIALCELARNDRIRTLTVGDGESPVVPVSGFRMISSVAWSADGRSFFLTGTAPEGGSVIRHCAAGGRSQLLYGADAWLERVLPSPDGRYLSFAQATSSSNVWTIENF